MACSLTGLYIKTKTLLWHSRFLEHQLYDVSHAYDCFFYLYCICYWNGQSWERFLFWCPIWTRYLRGKGPRNIVLYNQTTGPTKHSSIQPDDTRSQTKYCLWISLNTPPHHNSKFTNVNTVMIVALYMPIHCFVSNAGDRIRSQ